MFAATNTTSLTKSVGYTKAKTYQFRKIKEENTNKKQRFKRKPFLSTFNSTSATSQTLLSNTSAETVIELGGMNVLPPAWVDTYEEALEKLKKIKTIHYEAQELVAKRIKLQFGNHADLDARIDQKTGLATNLLRQCEENLNLISKAGSIDEADNEKQIRKNIEKSLATQIQEAALLLRKQQKGLLDKVKELNDTGRVSELNIETGEEIYSEDLQDMIQVEDIARERDEDINKLIDHINQLSHLFKDMNQIVIEQGTIVDRIDYNIEKATDNTVKAKKELLSAKNSVVSKCGAYVIKILVILNLVFSLLLLLKFGKRS